MAHRSAPASSWIDQLAPLLAPRHCWDVVHRQASMFIEMALALPHLHPRAVTQFHGI